MSRLHLKFSKENMESPSELDLDIAKYLDDSQGHYMDERIAKDSRFQVWQQLSELRKSLIHWYDFKKDADVLEIGAGFGTLTGVLCEKCAHVTVTEKSEFRAKAIAKRYEAIGNLEVYAGDVSDIAFDKKFDYILLIGLLERIGNGTGDIRYYAEYLSKLKALLKEDGKLLFAVDNRMGLKYFCGAAEPYTNKAFVGLNRYKQKAKGYTFSKKEVEDIVANAGFEHSKFYYPLPDYKFPQLIYTDSYLPEKNVKERLVPYYTRNDTLVAHELELYEDITENGVFPFFANSFLVECALINEPGEVVYAAISADRGKEKSFTTSIYEKGIVKKAFLYPEGRENADALIANMSELKKRGIPVVEHVQDEKGIITQPFIPWPTLSNVLKNLIKTDVEKFLAVIEQIYSYIIQSSEQVPESGNALRKRLLEELQEKDNLNVEQKAEEKERLEKIDFGPILKKAYIELIPLNCFYSIEEDKYLYFDQEFVRENYPAGYVMFRAIHYIYCFIQSADEYYPKQKLIEKYGLNDTWQYYINEEIRFQSEVRKHELFKQFNQWTKVDNKRITDNAGRLESEEEIIANYRVSDKMKKIWDIELAMLDEVDRICKKYSLRYFLVHGSLLGAVRHKGFIPWDDDLDIAMPREDYDKFLTFATTELKEPLSIHTALTESDIFWGSYARIRNKNTTAIASRNLEHDGNKGIWIDILPYDVCPPDVKRYAKKEKQIKKYYTLLSAKIYGKKRSLVWDIDNITWKRYWWCSHLYSGKSLSVKLDRAVRLYTDIESEEIAFFTTSHKFRRLCAKNFEECTYLTFERRQVPVPIGYENYLFETMGGDYMKYPPKEERKPKHIGIWDPDVSYVQYEAMLRNMFEDIEGKQLILWGAGLMFEDYMKKYGDKYRPEFLIDSDKNKWGRKRMGIEICSPEKLLELSKESYKLIICSYYYKEIAKQLENMGVTDYKVYVQHPEWILEAENRSIQ